MLLFRDYDPRNRFCVLRRYLEPLDEVRYRLIKFLLICPEVFVLPVAVIGNVVFA
jgi:hypothetical protein